MAAANGTAKAAAVTAVLATLAGCGGMRGGNIAYNPQNFGAPSTLPLPPADYRLGPGDVISVRVFKVDSLSGDQTIDAAGRISMPLIGAVQASGLTTAQLQAQLVAALGAKYLQSPDVAVTLKTALQKTLTVDGSVQQPGLYPIQPGTSLLQAIAMARGTAEGANPRRVVVFRQINGQRTAAAFDLTSIRAGRDPDPPVYANDTVVVDGSALDKAFHNVLQSIPLVTLFRPF